MENSNITKLAKFDIFKELHPIVKFYMSKGAKASALKKYYKNNKRFEDILDDIKSKGSNLVKDDSEYRKLVRTILNEILDDIIAKEKDDTYKNKNKNMKKLKTFESYFADDEEDDDVLNTNSYYVTRLESFREKLNSLTNLEEWEELKQLANSFEQNNDIESIESEWSDFKIYLDRKKLELAPNGVDPDEKFETPILNKFLDILKRIESKEEYDELVKDIQAYTSTINTKEMDDEFNKFKDVVEDAYYHISKKFKQNENHNSSKINEDFFETIKLFAIGFFLYKFLKSILINYISSNSSKVTTKLNGDLLKIILDSLKNMDKVPVIDLADRYIIRLNLSGLDFDIRVSKNDKTLEISGDAGKSKINLSDKEYSEFLQLIKK